MGVYIKGMEMPKDRPQLLWVYPNGKALTVQSDVDPRKELQAVPVPPHGRLGDLDKMLADNEIYYNQLGRADGAVGARYQSVKRSIELAPTIIPAEED